MRAAPVAILINYDPHRRVEVKDGETRMPQLEGFEASVRGLLMSLAMATPTSRKCERHADDFLLVREMHHRLANTLTIVAGALRREFATCSPPSVSLAIRESIERCEARIVALGKLNRTLAIGATDSVISLQRYVEHLCEALSEALLNPLGIKCEVFADAGEIPAQRGERLGLIISELVTNAAKHGFNGRKDGLVRVELLKKTDHWICTVSDNGSGMAKSPDGVGSKILEQLVGTLGGTLVRKSGRDGTAVVVTCKD